MIKHLEEKIIKGRYLSKKDAFSLSEVSGSQIFDLFTSANRIRNHFKGIKVNLCSIVNAKSGLCSEDCSFCAQSSKSTAKIEVYPLLSKETIIQKAKEANKSGAKRFSLVTSGRKVSDRELFVLADMISQIKKISIIPCASLGMLTERELEQVIERHIEKNRKLIKDRGPAAFSSLMGSVMSEVRGSTDPKTVTEKLKEKIAQAAKK